jgi:hypothetical protein
MGAAGDGGLEDYVSKLDRDMPGTFFGMTSMGDSQYLKRNNRKPIYKEVHQFPEEKFLKAFNQVATMNGNPDCCRRANLPRIFAIAMGRDFGRTHIDIIYVWKKMCKYSGLNYYNMMYNSFDFCTWKLIRKLKLYFVDL